MRLQPPQASPGSRGHRPDHAGITRITQASPSPHGHHPAPTGIARITRASPTPHGHRPAPAGIARITRASPRPPGHCPDHVGIARTTRPMQTGHLRNGGGTRGRGSGCDLWQVATSLGDISITTTDLQDRFVQKRQHGGASGLGAALLSEGLSDPRQAGASSDKNVERDHLRG